jgi:hypothetical protein
MKAVHDVRKLSRSNVNITNRVAQHAHPADRFAHEILGILGRDPTRSRRLMRSMLGRAVLSLLWLSVTMAIAHTACPLSDVAPARMPTQTDRRRIMPGSLAACTGSCLF